MSRRRLLIANTDTALIPNNEIWYVSSDGNIVEPSGINNIISNTYIKGYGIIKCQEDIVEIPMAAFASTNIVNITLPSSVKSIGYVAFGQCKHLTSVYNLSNVEYIGRKAFSECPLLSNIKLPSTLKTIEEEAFSYLPKLIDIIIPNSVRYIGSGAFKGCDYLNKVVLSNNIITIKTSTFEDCNSLTYINLPDSISSIEENAFLNCWALKKIDIPTSVVSIGNNAFKKCNYVERISIPYIENLQLGDNVFTESGFGATLYLNSNIQNSKSLENNPFYDSGITNLVIQESVTSIGDFAFAHSNIRQVNIPDNVENLGIGVFTGCPYLESFSGKFTSEDGSCIIVNNKLISFKSTYGYYTKDEYTIPSDITEIGSYALYNPFRFKKIIIESKSINLQEHAFYQEDNYLGNKTLNTLVINSDDIIGTGAFKHSGFNTIIFGNNIKTIPEKLLYDCNKVRYITVGAAVEKIESESFYNIGNNAQITMLPINPPSIGENVFFNFKNNFTIIVSKDKLTTYIKSDWDNELKEKIKGIEANLPDTYYIRYSTTDDETLNIENKNIVAHLPGQIIFIDEILIITNDQFKNCNTLKSITIPSSVKTIEGEAFWGCYNLEDFYCKAKTPPVFTTEESNIFKDKIPNIFIPNSHEEDYKKDTYWNKYASYIKPYDFNTDNRIQSNTEIWYKTVDNRSLKLNIEDTSIISNTYAEGLGIICYDDTITSIKECLFENMITLQNVSLPNTVTSVGNKAFKGCKNLVFKNINDDNSNNTIPGGKPITRIVIDADDKLINPGFGGTTVNTVEFNVELPSSIKSIGDYAFSNCTSISEIVLPNTLLDIGIGAFEKCSLQEIKIPKEVKIIQEKLFSGCVSLNKVYIEGNTQDIRNNAFENCAIEELHIKDLSNWCGLNLGLSNTRNPLISGAKLFVGKAPLEGNVIFKDIPIINSFIFYNYGYFDTVTIENTVEKLYSKAFEGCKIKKIDINCKVVPDYCFSYVFGIEEINFGGSVQQIGSYLIVDNPNISYTTLKNISISSDTIFKSDTFTGCNIEKIKVIVSDINNYCASSFLYLITGNKYLYDKNKLEITNLDINQDIGYNVFDNCINIESVNISSGCRLIGKYAFRNCENLEKITVSEGQKEFYNGVFLNTNVERVYIYSIESWCNEIFKDGHANPLHNGASLYLSSNEKTEITSIDTSYIYSVNDYAFCGCNSIREINISKATDEIGKKAFYNCKNVKTITVDLEANDTGDDVIFPTLGEDAFSGINTEEFILKFPNWLLAGYYENVRPLPDNWPNYPWKIRYDKETL